MEEWSGEESWLWAREELVADGWKQIKGNDGKVLWQRGSCWGKKAALETKIRPMTDVEHRFGEAMFAIYREAKDIGYTPRIFLRMLNEKGALETAGQLINAAQPSGTAAMRKAVGRLRVFREW